MDNTEQWTAISVAELEELEKKVRLLKDMGKDVYDTLSNHEKGTPEHKLSERVRMTLQYCGLYAIPPETEKKLNDMGFFPL